MGAYTFAGSIAQHLNDHEAAFKQYEGTMRPYVTNAQALPPGVPAVGNPQTWCGIALLRGVLGFASKSGLVNLIQKFSTGKSVAIDLPEHET